MDSDTAQTSSPVMPGAQPTPSSTQEQPAQPKSKYSKWIIAGLVVLLLLIVSVTSVYVLNKNLTSKNQTNQQIAVKITPTINMNASPTVSSRPPMPENISSFQKLLINKCNILEKVSPYWKQINRSELPIKLDGDKIFLSVVPDTSLANCDLSNTYKSDVEIPFQIYGYDFGGDLTLYVYDKQSEELGHGGPPRLGSYGTVIKNDGTSKYAVSFGFGEVPITYPFSTPVIISAEKKLHLSNGEDIYVSFNATLLHGDDPRLVNILSKYSVKRDDKSVEITDTTNAEKEMVTTMFGDLNNLKSPEKEKFAQIENVLSAVSLK